MSAACGGGGDDSSSSLLTHLLIMLVVCLSLMAVCTSNERRTAVRVVRCRWPTFNKYTIYISDHKHKKKISSFIRTCMFGSWLVITNE